MALPILFSNYQCLLSLYSRESFLSIKMYVVHVESDFVLQNCRCWQDIWTSNIEDIWTLKIQSVKIKSQTEIAGDIREIL